MRISLLIFLILPFLSISQSEREDKLRIKGSTNVSTQISENQSKIVVRDKHYAQEKQTFNNSNSIRPTPNINYGYYNWINWGAPTYGFNSFIPYYYYDRFGLRQPARIYNINGKQDTVRGQKTHWRLGLSYTTKNQIGGWITVGNRNFFIAEYSSYVPNDKSSFLPNITMSDVLPWNDVQLDDITSGGAIYAGAGTKVGPLGLYIMPGYEWERNNFQFFDELFILSNNGKYSFPNYTTNGFSGKAGVIYDCKMGTGRIDYNPFKQSITFGLGIIF